MARRRKNPPEADETPKASPSGTPPQPTALPRDGFLTWQLKQLFAPEAWLVLCTGLALRHFTEQWFGDSTRAANKPYTTFAEFYPFYLTEHSNLICRRLHFVGTSFVLMLALANPSLFVNAAAAGSLGLAVLPIFLGTPNGYVEGAACLATFVLLSVRSTKSFKAPLAVLAFGYGFAWVGHFFFEMNKPASFVYPVYSLAGDMVMWSQVLTGAVAR